MDFENEVKNALTELTNDGTFKIKQIVYDDKNFGNVIIEISSYKNLNIRFVRDRGDINCELEIFDEWFWIDDIFAVLGVKAKFIEKDIIETISDFSAQIKQNLPIIFKAFDEDNIKDTKKKIKNVATKRVMDLF